MMGLFSFGPSKRERQEAASRLEATAEEHAATGRQHRAKAAEVRERDRTARFKDPTATRAVAGQLEAKASIAETNARNLKAAAEKARKPWWR